jgi:membrane-associated protease RseP (regulator of RpoE activity)
MVVITAGSAMHFLQAFLLFVVIFTMVGVPRDSVLAASVHAPEPTWAVQEVLDGSAADQAGIEVGDRIVDIAGKPVKALDDVGPIVSKRAGAATTITVDRSGKDVVLPITIGHRKGQPKQGFLGVDMRVVDSPGVTTGLPRSVVLAGHRTLNWMGATVSSLGSFVTGGVGNFARDVVDGPKDEAQGPVVSAPSGAKAEPPSSDSHDDDRFLSIFGVARIGAQASEHSTFDFLLLLALVNISIGVLNLVPLLPLDGGHAAIAIYERLRSIRGRRHMTDVSRLLPLTYAVVMVLSLVMVSTLYMDIRYPVGIG